MSYKFGTPGTFASNKRSSTSQRPRNNKQLIATGDKEKRNKTPGVGANRQMKSDKIYWQAFQPNDYL